VTDEKLYASALFPLYERLRTTCFVQRLKAGGFVRHEQPFKEEDLLAHARGDNGRFGLYFLEHGSEVIRAACVDLDDHDKALPLDALLAAATRVAAALPDGWRAHPWLSSSGHGVHLWFVWDAAQDAYTVRKTLADTLRSAGFTGHGLTHFLSEGGVKAEVFPKQNAVAFGDFGNFAWLPLTGNSAPLLREGTTYRPGGREAAIGYTWAPSPPLPKADPPPPATPTSAPLHEIAGVQEAVAACSVFLPFIDPDPREDWFAVACSIHYETGGALEGFTLWDTWAQQSTKHDPEDAVRVWNSIHHARDDLRTLTSLRVLGEAGGWQQDFSDVFASALLAPPEDAPSENGNTFLCSVADFLQRPAPQYLVKGVLLDRTVSVIYGASAAGKTFFALDLLLSLAHPNADGLWQGHRVRDIGDAGIAYIAAEDSFGVGQRIKAWCRTKGITPEDLSNVFLHPGAPNMHEGDITELIRGLKSRGPIRAVVIDTLARVIPGANENGGEDMGPFLAKVERITAELQCAAVIVHHSGKDETRGLRGWSGLAAAVDATIHVGREKEDPLTRKAVVTKMKGAPEGETWFFRINSVELGRDEDGDPVTAGVAAYITPEEALARAAVAEACAVGPKTPKSVVVATLLELLEETYGLRDSYEGLGVSECDLIARLQDNGSTRSAYRSARKRAEAQDSPPFVVEGKDVFLGPGA
jgi:hypothetical protein